MPGIGLVTMLALSLMGAEPLWPDLAPQHERTKGLVWAGSGSW